MSIMHSDEVGMRDEVGSDIRLDVHRLNKSYGTGDTAVLAMQDVTFQVRGGEFLCIVGPSGAGKTTLLRCLAGLLKATDGRAVLDGREISGPPPGLAMVFQDYSRSLMPWLKVSENVGFPLRNKSVSRPDIKKRSLEALEEVGIAQFRNKYPHQLSGGMQQRVAIARALAYRPDVLLMDEPFASVDAQTRADLEDLTLQLQRASGITTVLVTHDIDEAVYLGDRIVVLSKAPSVVDNIVSVDLPRDRDQISTKEHPTYSHLRSEVLRMVKHA